LFVLEGFPPYAINAFIAGTVLIDAATRFDARRIVRRARIRGVTAHALSHAHPDHQGASHAVCEALGIPLWCGEADAYAMETRGEIMARMPKHWLSGTVGRLWTGPPHPVSRRLREGDVVASFRVIETPGHTAGHISFWRDEDRTLITGDVLCNVNIWNGRVMLREPEAIFTLDPIENRRSAQRFLALEPRLVCFGHGPPLRDTQKFMRYLEALLKPG
jgi:glyoxylase-like metal-dependent hydrolase (beta-lactamase superfamily II)